MTLDLVPSDEKILPPVPPPVTDTDASTDSTISVGILESYASRVFLEDGLSDYLEKKCWPIGLQKLLVEELNAAVWFHGRTLHMPQNLRHISATAAWFWPLNLL